MKNENPLWAPLKEMPVNNPISFDKEKCIGCNACGNICQVDVLIPNSEKGKHPIVMFPGECWYCGCCAMECPVEGAIKLSHPLMNRVRWVAKDKLLKG